MADLSLSISGKHYKINRAEIHVLGTISLYIPYGEKVAIVGSSGCGKTTLLRFILGLEKPDSGTIEFGNRTVVRPGSDRGIMFQDARLLPWMTVAENIGFAQKKADKQAINQMLAEVGLSDYAKFYPSQLSGGMAQRAALARALINYPKLLCLDEPLSAVDSRMRNQLIGLIQKLQKNHGFSLLLVTHRMEEANALCQRIITLGGMPTHIMKDEKYKS